MKIRIQRYEFFWKRLHGHEEKLTRRIYQKFWCDGIRSKGGYGQEIDTGQLRPIKNMYIETKNNENDQV